LSAAEDPASITARSLVIAARVLAFAAAAACPAGGAVVGAAAAAVVGATAAGATGAAVVAAAAVAVPAGAGDETGAAEETGGVLGVVFCAAGVTLLWCPAHPVASVTTSVTPATRVREDLRVTSAPSRR